MKENEVIRTKCGGIEGLTRYEWSRDGMEPNSAENEDRSEEEFFAASDVERLLATAAGEQAEPAIVWASEKFVHERIATLMAQAGVPESTPIWNAFCQFEADLRSRVSAAPAAPEQVQAVVAEVVEGKYANRLQWISDDAMTSVPPGTKLCAAPSAAQVQAEPLTVKVERNRVWIVRGNQSFMMGYLAIEGDDPAEIQAYADNLRAALSGFTPDVKITAPIAAAPAAPEQVQKAVMALRKSRDELDRIQARAAGSNAHIDAANQYQHAVVQLVNAALADQSAAPEQDEVRNQALEDAAKVCDSMGGDIDMRNVDEVKLCANSLAHEIRAMKTATNEGDRDADA